MLLRRLPLLSAALLAFAAGPCLAEPLAVKTGLWETAGSGAPATAAPQIPESALAKLTPEQRAMVQQRMAAASSGGGGTKVCITEESRQKGIGDRSQGRCTRTVISSTAQALQIHLECTGPSQATGTLTITAVNAETIDMVTDMTVLHNGQQMPMHRTMQSHWLAADCGSVKPMQ